MVHQCGTSLHRTQQQQLTIALSNAPTVCLWICPFLAAMQALTDETVLAQNVGIGIVAAALRQQATILLPTKILQRVKRCLRWEARKLIEMGVRECLMHILRIDLQEIPRLPPHFNATQMLSDDEIVDILLFGTPKSWQREMDRKGVDPLASAPHEAATFMECIEMLEDFECDKKTTKVAPGKGKKKSGYNKGNLDADGSKHCVLHGNNSTHDTSECKTLMVRAKKLKGSNGADKKGKGGGNKSWKNKAKDKTDDSKKELAALIKKATEVIKKSELNAVEPVKKRKVNWPSEEEELCALDAELKDFKCEDLDKMDLKGESKDEKEEGQMDLSASEEVSDEVSVWMAGQDEKGSLKAPVEKEDKLDLILSPPCFLAPVGDSETREIFAFDAQEDDDSMLISSDQDFSDLDDCIDQSCRTKTFSIANLIWGRKPKWQKTEDSRPTSFVRFNTSPGAPLRLANEAGGQACSCSLLLTVGRWSADRTTCWVREANWCCEGRSRRRCCCVWWCCCDCCCWWVLIWVCCTGFPLVRSVIHPFGRLFFWSPSSNPSIHMPRWASQAAGGGEHPYSPSAAKHPPGICWARGARTARGEGPSCPVGCGAHRSGSPMRHLHLSCVVLFGFGFGCGGVDTKTRHRMFKRLAWWQCGLPRIRCLRDKWTGQWKRRNNNRLECWMLLLLSVADGASTSVGWMDVKMSGTMGMPMAPVAVN